jgi:aspartate/methionine/tyrosine aminotransferase
LKYKISLATNLTLSYNMQVCGSLRQTCWKSDIIGKLRRRTMKPYCELSKDELRKLREELLAEYEDAKGKGLKLDMSRGKPSPLQLDLTMDMLDTLTADSDMKSENGLDTRNYGVMDGVPEAKKLVAEMMGVLPENVIVFGNASLPIMYDTISRSMTHGVCGSTPWCKLEKVKFLCPAPGYDRHFAITQHFGIEMITIPMLPTGPDMDMVEKLVSEDAAVKGIWCVPKYSNPQGISYSDETVRRFAALKPAAEDFRIFWDNAYAVHHLYDDDQDEILEILSECEKAGNPNLVYEFCSTSKISFAGAGIAAMISSKENLDFVRKSLTIQTIGYDKVNQLRHVRYFKNAAGIREHMSKHAKQLRPKFEAVLSELEAELTGLGIGEWTKPKGGYFISFDAMEGCAKAIVAKCKEAGVVLTGAGATFPYGVDPKDSNIRIAPSYPSAEEMAMATELFILCVKLVSVEKLLETK